MMRSKGLLYSIPTLLILFIFRLCPVRRNEMSSFASVGCERDVKLGEHGDFELVMLASFPGFELQN